jgi:hypothetical protein
MKAKYLIIALIISLAFNIGFVAMGIVNNAATEPIMPQRQHNRQRGTRFVQSEELREARRANLAIRNEFFRKLASEEFDPFEKREIIERLLVSQQELEFMVCQHFMTIRENMTDEEASEFFGRFHRRERRHRVR